MIMKKQNAFLLLASVMLVAMNFASCKMSNKPAAETSRIGEIPVLTALSCSVPRATISTTTASSSTTSSRTSPIASQRSWRRNNGNNLEVSTILCNFAAQPIN